MSSHGVVSEPTRSSTRPLGSGDVPLTIAMLIRQADPLDAGALTDLLTAALDSSLAAWVYGGGHKAKRDPHGYVAGTVMQAVASGVIRVAVHGDDIMGAALWTLRPTRSSESASISRSEGGCCAERLRRLQVLTEVRRPAVAHYQLGLAGVRPDLRGRGIGGALLIAHHLFLQAAGLGAYAVCDDGPRRRLLLRHRYTDIGPPQLLAGGIPVWSMWRPPGPAHPL